MQGFESLLGESPAPPGESPKPEGDESPGLSELLSESEAGAEGESPEGESRQKTPVKRFIDLAERLTMKADDLYALTVAFDDGTSKTIGELKDIGQKATDFDAAHLELETKRREQDARMTRMQGELRELLSALPETARSGEAFQKAAERYDKRLKLAREAAIASIEEWKDADVMQREREEISKFLTSWGFEAGYLDMIADPRSLRFLRDAWKLDARVKAAMDRVKSSKPASKGGSGGPAGKQKRPAQTNGEGSVSKRYDELLN